jgi:membrane protein implicated in regulation of membrane protease activity
MQILGFNFWIFLGVLFLILEFISGSFYAVFFAGGAILTGILKWLGIINDIELELILFVICSISSLYFFRKHLKELFKAQKDKVLDSKVNAEEVVGEE